MRKLIIFIFLIPFWVNAQGKQVDLEIDAAAKALLSLKIYSGSLKISEGSGNHIKITGTLGERVGKLTVVTGDEGISILPEIRAKDLKSGRAIACDLRVTMPAEMNLRVESSSGAVEISGLKANINASSSSGDLHINGTMSSVRTQTISGSILLSGASEIAEGVSIGGTVTINGNFPDITAKTASGSISVNTERSRRASVFSTSGTIDFTGGTLDHATVILNSVSSSITIAPGKLDNLRINLRTLSGKVTLPENINKNAATDGGRRIYQNGSSESTITAESISGNMTVETANRYYQESKYEKNTM